ERGIGWGCALICLIVTSGKINIPYPKRRLTLPASFEQNCKIRILPYNEKAPWLGIYVFSHQSANFF
ncbi:MAG: hypothetical protein PVJ21_06600, partial [Anaerolineales bacterium]